MDRRRWIKLYMMDYDEVYQDSKMLHLWIDILLHTNPTDFYHHGDLIRRGQCILSLNQVAERCHMSKHTVKKYLGLLEECGKVTLDISRKGTKVTVLNWDKYQDNYLMGGATGGAKQHQEVHQEQHQEVHQEQHQEVHRNKNKRIKEIKNKRTCTVPSSNSIHSYFVSKDAEAYADEFLSIVRGRTDISNWRRYADGFIRNKMEQEPEEEYTDDREQPSESEREEFRRMMDTLGG